MQTNSTLRVEEQNSNNTNGINNEKGFWDWLADIVAPKPPTVTEPSQAEKCTTCSTFEFIMFLIFVQLFFSHFKHNFNLFL